MKTCIWKNENIVIGDDANIYGTECGKAFQLNEGTPSENNMKYCPFCGCEIIKERTK